MDTIIKYLKNPMDVGIKHTKLCIDFSDCSAYYHKEFEDNVEKIKGKKNTKNNIKIQEDRVQKVLNKFDEHNPSENIFKLLMDIIMEYSHFTSLPPSLSPYFNMELSFKDGEKLRIPRQEPVNLFISRALYAEKDVSSIESSRIDKNNYLLDLVCIKGEGISSIINFLKEIPPLKDKIRTVKEVSHYSSRYVFRPYNLAVELWLKDDTSLTLPSDLKSMLEGATRYIASNEWRTSIVLSAITSESILADIYEEVYQKQAPDVPLGNLFQHVKDKVKFPSEIITAIEATNEARIAAVHRSRFTVSNREAVNALYGTTNLATWYSLNY